MTAKKQWAKPTSGPDWTDVEMMLRALAAMHSASVGVTLLQHGTGATGGLSVGANCMFNVLPGSSLPPALSISKRWPCAQHSDLAAHVFALLHELDFKIGQTYKNEKLWE
jgi:hypothetical protein